MTTPNPLAAFQGAWGGINSSGINAIYTPNGANPRFCGSRRSGRTSGS